jgi:two-component system nitrogen regulation response regulator NtrX
MNCVLIVDDEKNIRTSLEDTFGLEGYRTLTAEDGLQALEVIERGGVDLLLLDLQMPKLDGLGLLRRMRELGHEQPVIFLTAHGTIELAVEAVRAGAFDFIEKPPHADKILLTARNALRQADLEDENRDLREESESRYDMIGSSKPMQDLYEQIQRIAPTQVRALILGENGSGKELIARALHKHSPRADSPFVRLNCAAVPRELFESELFGHEKGAFTGATRRRRGKFPRAHRGTLFLDEIGEIPLELQPKFLRALESGEVEPVGSDHEIKVDVRVIAATNRDIERAVAQNEFRSDLYYRLHVVTLQAPPLRERKSDIPALAEHFVRLACMENNLPSREITAAAMGRLQAHDYPGNVRELRNVIERMVILSPGRTIGALEVDGALPAAGPGASLAPELSGSLKETMTELERRVVLEALTKHGWRMTAAANALGLERSHLYKKLKSLGISRPE